MSRARAAFAVLCLILAAATIALWVRSDHAGDAFVLFVGRGRAQAIASSNGRLGILFTNVSFQPERAWTATFATGDLEEFTSWLDINVLHVYPAPFAISPNAISNPLGDGFHGFRAITSEKGAVDGIPDSKIILLTFPHWFAILIFCAIAWWTFVGPAARRQRRLTRGQCVHCGYDLRASTEKCPECGAAIPAAPARK